MLYRQRWAVPLEFDFFSAASSLRLAAHISYKQIKFSTEVSGKICGRGSLVKMTAAMVVFITRFRLVDAKVGGVGGPGGGVGGRRGGGRFVDVKDGGVGGLGGLPGGGRFVRLGAAGVEEY